MISVLLGLHTFLLLVFYAVTSRKYTEGCSGQGHDLANDTYSQTAKTVFSHLKYVNNA